MIARCPSCGAVAIRRRCESQRTIPYVKALAVYLPIHAAVITGLLLFCLLLSFLGTELTSARERVPEGMSHAGFALVFLLLLLVAVLFSLWLAQSFAHWRTVHLAALALAATGFVSLAPYLWHCAALLWTSKEGWITNIDGTTTSMSELADRERHRALLYAGELLPQAMIVLGLCFGMILLFQTIGLDALFLRRERKQLLRRTRRRSHRKNHR